MRKHAGGDTTKNVQNLLNRAGMGRGAGDVEPDESSPSDIPPNGADETGKGSEY
jgi:hypothetical protein